MFNIINNTYKNAVEYYEMIFCQKYVLNYDMSMTILEEGLRFRKKKINLEKLEEGLMY